KLEPVRIVLAVLVLLAGLAITQLVQRWLTDTYLPKTELDLGARARQQQAGQARLPALAQGGQGPGGESGGVHGSAGLE
ncbi:hypothetical protein EN855_037030, partial [Mesorhizobium sp. M1C.F.Ca.ET.212.01.1.1]